MKIKTIILMLLCLIITTLALSSCNEKKDNTYADLLAPKSTIEKDVESDIKWPSELFPDEFPIFTQNVSSLEKEEYAFILKVKDINYKEYDSFIQRITDRNITNLKRITGISYYDRYLSTYIYEKDGKSEAFMVIYDERNEYSFCIMGTKEDYYPDGKIIKMPTLERYRIEEDGDFSYYYERIETDTGDLLVKMKITNTDKYTEMNNKLQENGAESKIHFLLFGNIYNPEIEAISHSFISVDSMTVSERFNPDNEDNFYEIINVENIIESEGFVNLKIPGYLNKESPVAHAVWLFPVYTYTDEYKLPILMPYQCATFSEFNSMNIRG